MNKDQLDTCYYLCSMMDRGFAQFRRAGLVDGHMGRALALATQVNKGQRISQGDMKFVAEQTLRVIDYLQS